MRYIFVFLCLFLWIIPSPVHAQYPTDSARVYLITASPGTETYAVFGHSALRVTDPVQGYDMVYNWGTFDFDTENFYLKFGTGKLMYFLATNDYQAFLYAYYRNGQAIYLQELNLTNQEKYTLLNNIRVNDQDENRYFRYDFFRDNCATRIRDIVVKSMAGEVVFDSAYVPKRESFRRLFGAYLTNEPWTYFGLNLIMGKSTDSIASIHDYMYLPGHLKNLFTTAKVVTPQGSRNLTREPVQLFPSTIVVKKPSAFTSPGVIMALLFVGVLLVTFWELRRKKYLKGLDIFLFLVTGLLGILISWLWGWSLHIYVHHNFHIVWASPLNFIAALLLIFYSSKSPVRYYFLAYAISILAMIPVSFFMTQEIQVASYFLMGIMVVRALRIYARKKETD